MRHTLEQLKGMSRSELYDFWMAAQFPFDKLKGCDRCLTQHHSMPCELHSSIREEIQRMGDVRPVMRDRIGDEFVEHLEELYALRLFYDHLYAPELPSAADLDAVAAEERIREATVVA